MKTQKLALGMKILKKTMKESDMNDNEKTMQ